MLNPDGGASVEAVLLEEKLGRIRLQSTLKLENQKNLALILSAVEENIDDQKNDRTPVTYFVSFLSLLEQCVRDEEVVDSGLATTTAYFLDLIFPATPDNLLRQKFADILTKLAPALTAPGAEAPLVRSCIGALETLLVVQDHHQWTASGNVSPKRALIGLLELSFDPRPKVRRRAQEAVFKILTNPPPSPSPVHIAAPLCAELALARLGQLINGKSVKSKENNQLEIIHCLQLIGQITKSNSWPTLQIGPLCDALLEVSKASDQFLLSLAFSAFEGLFRSMQDTDYDKFIKCLDVIFDLKPARNDAHLAGAWLAVVAKAMETYIKLAPQDLLKRLPKVVPIISSYLASNVKDIYVSASQCLISLVLSIPDEWLVNDEVIEEIVEFFAEFTAKELLTVKYQHAVQEILEFTTISIQKFRSKANPDYLEALAIVGEWRTNENDSFPNKAAEDVVSAAIANMGPEVVISVLPLNLDNSQKGPGRAWLLPLLRDNVRFASLEFFKKDILPYVQFFEGKIKSSEQKQSVTVKVFQTIIDQVWSLLPHFCDLPNDLPQSFDEQFASQLADLLYSNVELRVPICHALKMLVELNVAYSEGAMADDALMQQIFPIQAAQKNIDILSNLSSNLLLVLFNVFSLTSPSSRGFVLETIDVYLQVIGKNDLENTFNKVCSMLKNALDEEAEESAANKPSNKDNSTKLSVTMMDLVVAMAKYVPKSSHNALFSILANGVRLPDALIQKRAYRIITRLIESGDEGKNSIAQFLGDIETIFVETTEGTQNSSRAARLAAISEIIDLLPQLDLHFIPAILQEVIMSTKDVNERTREIAYKVLISMGKKMQEGGIVENGKVPGFDPTTPSSTASLDEYFTMVSAGLAAQAPHMISATITALSCLVFEFKEELNTDMLLEIALTVELFLTHNSREIAKSAIGFVKVEVLSLPESLVLSNMKEMLAKLMRWSHEHKGHFKLKVKHIIERLIRKFGVEVVEENIPDEDRKLVLNIKKTRARNKRKEEESGEGDENNSGNAKQNFASAYEEALYDSDDSDNEEEDSRATSGSNKKGNRFIMESGDEPLDLLDAQALARITSLKPQTGKKGRTTKQKEANGKLVFGQDDDDDLLSKSGSGIDAYLDAIKQAPVKGQRNKLKYKRSAKQEEDWSDSDEETSKPTKLGNKVLKPRKKKQLKARKKL